MYSMEFSNSDVNCKNNFFRNYNLVCENILDIILKHSSNGITSDEITQHIGIRPSSIRRFLAKMINRKNCKKYFIRKRSGSFKYFKVDNYNPKDAYKDIINSDVEKVTANQVGLKDSIYIDKLIENGEIFPNVVNVLKKERKWFLVSEIAEILGVNHKRGRTAILSELRRCEKCSLKFVERIQNGDTKKFRLVYKYRKFTVSELKQLAKSTFPQDENAKIQSGKIQALNEILKMKKGINNE